MITLTLKRQPTVVLEAEKICPDGLLNANREEILGLPVYHGKRQLTLGDFFEVEGECSDHVRLIGNLHRVRMVGQRMSRGRIEIQGDIGMHLGAYMTGGQISVTGNVGDWLGAEMVDGLIEVNGTAGGQVGAAYRGSLSGMSGGTIVIRGDAGIEVGMRMKRGTILVEGKARDFAGLQMKGGTIVLTRGAEIRTGAWMVRGTIISLEPLQMMPTFRRSADYNPTFMNVYAKHFRDKLGVEIPFLPTEGAYARYCGDKSVPGKGEILIWTPAG